MFGGALTSIQRLTIAEQTTERLLLREYPRMEWLFGLALALGSIIPLAMNLSLTGVATLAAGLLIGLRARRRDILFDRAAGTMTAGYYNVFRGQVVNTIPLMEIKSAYLRVDESGSSQVILLTIHGESGLTVYSKDVVDWKTPLVDAVNQFLGA